jgi:RsiW-degrading membrane proteinase PrsW (M82 family)
MSPVLFIALLGGVLPALLWLAFWLMEDRCEPEPKRYIILTFIGGGLSVFVALWLERYIMNTSLPGLGILTGTSLLLAWATIEELVKFGAAYFIAMRSRAFDEPLDAVVYMITAALGFAAFENTLFLLTPLQDGDVLKTIITGDLRFIGSTLLHTLASATIGIALALAFYKRAAVKRLYALVGVILSIFLHTVFNFFILGAGGGATFWVFLCIWLGVVMVLFMTEQIKQPARDYC